MNHMHRANGCMLFCAGESMIFDGYHEVEVYFITWSLRFYEIVIIIKRFVVHTFEYTTDS